MKKLLILIAFLIPIGLFGQYDIGESINISQAYDGDLYVAGGTVTISAPVNGDLVAAGGDILIYDSIAQDLIAAGGNISVKSTVSDDIRCAGGTINIGGDVLDDVIIFGGRVTIDREAKISGNLIVFGGKVRVLGRILGNIKATGGDIDLIGEVSKDISIKSDKFALYGTALGASTIVSESLYIDTKSHIGGDLNYWTDDGEIDIPEGVVNGSVYYDQSLRPEGSNFGWGETVIIFFFLVTTYILAVFLIVLVLNILFGKKFHDAAESFNTNVGASLGYGMMYIIGVPIVIVILMTLVIGIPLGLFLLALYIFSIAFSVPIAGLLFANFLSKIQGLNWNKGMIVIMALVSAIIIRLITFIPIVGWLIGILVTGLALGAFIQSWTQTIKA